MAIDFTGNAKITIRGTVTNADSSTSVVAITTIPKVSADNMQTATMNALLNRLQAVISVPITAATVTFDVYDSAAITTQPGDVLESSEIFSEEFSDTVVVPSLQLMAYDSSGKTKAVTAKYAADPYNTESYEDKVSSLGSALNALTGDTLDRANITFSAKDEVYTMD